MIRSTHSCRGAVILPLRVSFRGFTLLEMCIVLFIIALLAGAMTPALQSVLAEQAVHNDSRQLSYLVRAAMLQSSEQHRPYVIDLTSTNLALHPLDEVSDDTATSTEGSGSQGVKMTHEFESSNKLLVPDPDKTGSWMAMPETSWRFLPGELCPASRVRLARGQAWLEVSFNALTGNVENETTYFP